MGDDWRDLGKVTAEDYGQPSKERIAVADIAEMAVDGLEAVAVLHGHLIPDDQRSDPDQSGELTVFREIAAAEFVDVEGDFELGVGGASTR